MRPDAIMLVSRDNKSVDGESTDVATGDDSTPIEILSFSYGIEQVERAPTTAGQAGAAHLAEHLPIRVLRLLDNASPTLHDYAGKRYDDLMIGIALFNRTGDSKGKSDSWTREIYAELTLSHAMISGVKVVLDPSVHEIGRPYPAGSECYGMGPLEELEITYGKIVFSYGKSSNKMTWTHSKYKQS